MFRKLSVVAVAVAAVGLTTLPASAATASPPRPHSFSIPSASRGVSAWGSYLKSGHHVTVTVCVKDRSRSILGDAAGAVAFSASGKYKGVSTIAFRYGQTSCRSMTTTYTTNLYVSSIAFLAHGYRQGKLKQVY